jgi:ABC-type Fe3+ transport system permease subunit
MKIFTALAFVTFPLSVILALFSFRRAYADYRHAARLGNHRRLRRRPRGTYVRLF